MEDCYKSYQAFACFYSLTLAVIVSEVVGESLFLETGDRTRNDEKK